MRAFVCIDGRNWESVIHGVARYLHEGEAIVAHVVDERAPRGYEMALRGLLGRRRRRSEAHMISASQAAAEELLADAAALLKQLRPSLTIKTEVLSGLPNEELLRAGGEAQTIFVGRGAPGVHSQVMVSGIVRGWRRNPHGDTDGLSLDNEVDVRFPPHKATEIQALIREGTQVEVSGVQHEHHLHAHTITDLDSETSIEAHKPPSEEPGKNPLGHTARFIVDHAPHDVVVLHP